MKKLLALRDIQADLWVFDNDGTLYKNPQELEKEVVERMIKFIALEYGISSVEAAIKRKALLAKHGTKYTLVAVKLEGMDESTFLRETYLSIDPGHFGLTISTKLYNLLSSLSGRRIVLTNNPAEFAKHILTSLGVIDLFTSVLGMREMGYVQKPDMKAFAPVSRYMSENEKVIFVDDEYPNISTASSIGWTTVFIGRPKQDYSKGYWMPELQ